MTLENLKPETLALHGGTYRSDSASGAVAVPIYQTTSYQFRDTEHADQLFSLDEVGHIYTRVSNPTQDAFEQRRPIPFSIWPEQATMWSVPPTFMAARGRCLPRR
jgi:O-acetylhomoserine/O-acetylserine sulfhydrylase-like pyridoxal-dependent enzyme